MPTMPRSRTAQPASEIRKRLLAKVHVLKSQQRLDDEDYRDMLHRVTGKRSAALCSQEDLVKVIERLKPQHTAGIGPYHAKVMALWITAYNLGIANNPSDTAMLAFVTRQTGIEAIRWLRDPADANRAIESLKGWIARAGAVDWTAYPDNPRRAVVEAQWRRLCGLGAVWSVRPGENHADALMNYIAKVTGCTAMQWMSEENWDAAIKALGSKLRASIKRPPPATKATLA
jgi:hypothetical protein